LKALLVSEFKNRKKADALVLPFFKTNKGIAPAFKETVFEREIYDFKAKEGEVFFLYPLEGEEKRILLLGLGDEKSCSLEKIRNSYWRCVKPLREKECKSVNFLLPKAKLPQLDILECAAEGLFLANYSFDQFKKEKSSLLEEVTFLNVKKGEERLKKIATIAHIVHLVRDLVNQNADTSIPSYLASFAKEMEKKSPKTKVQIHDKKWIEKEGLGFLLAVSRAALPEPRFIIVKYVGNPQSKDHTVLVGKGITYDTGGLNLKPGTSMDAMKADMAGAAAVLGAIFGASQLKLKVNVTAVVPAAENAIGPASYKPGDVYKGFEGKTVEITSTDAEGRLVLADALAWVKKHLKPTRMIDLATLTGSIIIALGNDMAGLFSSDDKLAHSLIQAAEKTGEKAWRMPLISSYVKMLKSEIADLKNSGGRPGGSITGALFIQQFVGDIPWAHFDIAGPAYLEEKSDFHPSPATGYGVRLLIEFLIDLLRN